LLLACLLWSIQDPVRPRAERVPNFYQVRVNPPSLWLSLSTASFSAAVSCRRCTGIGLAFPKAFLRVYARVLVPPNLYIHTYIQKPFDTRSVHARKLSLVVWVAETNTVHVNDRDLEENPHLNNTHSMQTRSALRGLQPQLLQLSGDALGAVLCLLSPRAVGRLQCTCSALAGAASENKEWRLMRSIVRSHGWKTAFNAALCSGNLQQLEWGRAQGCQMDETTCRNAAASGQMEAMRWLRAQTPPCAWDQTTCESAAVHGNLELLQWMRNQSPPCPWDATTCTGAAMQGNLDVLKWARNQTPPCPWDANTCRGAAMRGHLDVLKWVRSQTPLCPWDVVTCLCATKEGRVEVLRWLRAQVPPCLWIAPELLQWLRAEVEEEQGGPVG